MNSQIEEMPSENILDAIAEAWGLRNIQFVRKMENIVFSCDSEEGKAYLRLTTPLRRGRDEIEAEINWIEHLAKCDLKVPSIILDRSGRKIANFREGKNHFEAVVFSALEGKHPPKEIAADPNFLKKLGALIAKMHHAAERHEGLKREEWFEERGFRHAMRAATLSSENQLKSKFEEVVSWMSMLDKNRENYGLVHADLGALNLFIGDDDSIGVIDFDDSCYHFFSFDLAIVIFSMAGRFGYEVPHLDEKEWLRNLVEGYRTIRFLSDDEIQNIARFIQFATLRLFFWIEDHEFLGTFHEEAKPKVKELKDWSRKRALT